MHFIGSLLGICEDISTSRYEHWSALAPLPSEVVLSAAQKSEDSWQTGLIFNYPANISHIII